MNVLGCLDVPTYGDILNVAPFENHISYLTLSGSKVLELFRQVASVGGEGVSHSVRLVITKDGQLKSATIKSEEVRISIVHSAVGAINESDVMLASASNALIIGFNVRPDANARAMAEKDGVDVRLYRVIYDCIDDVKAAMAGMLSPTIREVVLGHAEIRQVIHTPKVIVAGSYVQDGKITSNCQLRLIRDGIVIHEGKIASLRRFKDDVKEVAAGFECGIAIDSYRDVKEGDQLESFELKEEAAELK